MAKLNPSLIFSMTRELSELHEIGQEMITHFGNCKTVSWRFPDRAIKDIEIDLDQKLFDTSEKYVLLLELIIDRLYLILNVTIDIFNLMPELSQKAIFKLPKNVCKPLGLSFGTLMSLFWKRLQILVESKDVQFSSKSSNNTTIYNSACNSQNEIIPQTCMSCETAMKMVKSLINTIMESMDNLKLESVIAVHRSTTEKDIINLTQFDAMQQWCECISTDIQSLTVFAKKKTVETKMLIKDTEGMKQEIEAHIKKWRMGENKCVELEKNIRDANSKLQNVTLAKDDLLSKFNHLTLDLNRCEEISISKIEKINELQNEIQQISHENESSTQHLEEDFQKQINLLNAEKEFWTDLCNKSKAEIEELQSKMKLQQEQQTKLESQLQDQVITEKQKINDEKLKFEYENLKLIQEVEHGKEQMKAQETEFNMKIKLLEDENEKLEENLKECKKREQILIQCPDLNGPIICQKEKQNPLQDMEQQLESNEVRIQLLQEQNSNLRRIVDKMKKLNKQPGK